MTRPLVATYWLLADLAMPNEHSIIPKEWQYARFDTTDILYIASFYVLPRQDSATGETQYKFGLQDGEASNGWLDQYESRYKWVVTEARTQNPSIRIIATMMMWKDDSNNPLHIGDLNVLYSADKDIASAMRDQFATSVTQLLLSKSKETYTNSSGQAVSARIDGFDIDIEDGNLPPYLPDVLFKLHTQFKSSGEKFYLSITPAWTTYLDKSLSTSLDYLNMQNYDGGSSTSPQAYHEATGLPYSKLLWVYPQRILDR